MSLPGGIRVKLALALLLIVGGALAAAYAVVVPQLERRLVDAKLDQLQRDATNYAVAFSRQTFLEPLSLDAWVDGAAQLTNSRVVVFDVFESPVVLLTQTDSANVNSEVIRRDAVALEAASSGRITRGTVTRGGRKFAEVAVPLLPPRGVMLLSASLDDQLSTVELVERRLAYAMLAAVAIALSLGSVVAAMHARRIRRLERAANRIAAGHFDEPVVDTGDDELGQLATAFDRMRIQLAQLDTARKEFVANASHELRTPLFSLGGFLELLADEDLDEETRRGFLATSREQVDRLTKLATDLLDLSRLGAGRLHVARSPFDLAEVAHVLSGEFRALARTGGRSVELEGGADEVLAVGDDERSLQIGRALVENALRHTPPGTTVRVGAARRGGSSVLEIADDGPGIAPEHAQQIFERFYRVDGALASGSGLGLAIARELAELMGGRVELDSSPGRNAFRLVLPAAIDEFSRENVAAGVG
jgi:signal transduction histidine kinase